MTLKEIAGELNVSPSTVSRVLNGYSKNFTIKPELRARILERVEESGYKPNRIFSSLRSKECSQISFLFYDRNLLKQTSPVSDAVDAISQELAQRNYTFNFIPCESIQNLYYPVPEWKVAGLIVPDVIYPRQLKYIEEAGIPYVVVNGVCGKSGSAIMSDEVANMRMVMEHLHSFGHRRIGYLDGFVPGNHHHSFSERKRGYAEFCEEYGLEQFQSEPWKYSPIEAQFEELRKRNITALICYSDKIAREALYLAWRRGLRVPEELSVITFNDMPSHAFTIPPLDTLAVPGTEMGAAAAQTIIAKLENPGEASGYSIRIPGRIVHRESVAPAPGV